MMIKNRHERIIAAAPERIAALIWDFDRIWQAQIAPAPGRHGDHLYDAGLMLWKNTIARVPRVRSGWLRARLVTCCVPPRQGVR